MNFGSERILSSKENELSTISQKLKTIPIHFLQKTKHQLEVNTLKINLFNPKNTLNKGFSITRKDGKAIKSIKDIQTGDIILTEMKDGTIESIIK